MDPTRGSVELSTMGLWLAKRGVDPGVSLARSILLIDRNNVFCEEVWSTERHRSLSPITSDGRFGVERSGVGRVGKGVLGFRACAVGSIRMSFFH